jgi:5-methylcytosine-specific restriction enzyme subunit McrC
LDTKNKHIVVFEHESIRWDKGDKKITQDQFHALEKYYGNGTPILVCDIMESNLMNM